MSGGKSADAEPAQFLAEDVELVGVAEVEGHQCGEELDREVRLQVGGLVGRGARRRRRAAC